jgi:hypothetical protein
MDFRRYVPEHLPPLSTGRERDIVDELAQHLGDLYDEARADGATHEAALAHAIASLPTSAELARDIESANRALPGLIADRWRAAAFEPAAATSRFPMLGDVGRDVIYAMRTLTAAPGFALVVFLTLALGVGANAVIFTAIDAILLETPGITNPDSIVSVYNNTTDGSARFSTVSYPDFADLRDAHVFHDAAAYASIPLAFDRGEQVEAISGELVFGSFFDVLGTRFSLGRGFLPDEDRRGAPASVVVVSDAFWRNRLDASPTVVGATIRLNGRAYTVIGVAPPLFTGATVGAAPDVWAPMALQQELRPPSAGLRRVLQYNDLLGARGPRGGSVLLVLLLACANISSLLLARSASRRLPQQAPLALRFSAAARAPLRCVEMALRPAVDRTADRQTSTNGMSSQSASTSSATAISTRWEFPSSRDAISRLPIVRRHRGLRS